MAEKEMSKEEKKGYHKGAINTLLGERTELVKMLQITESLMHAHAKELEKMGVKISLGEEQAEKKK